MPLFRKSYYFLFFFLIYTFTFSQSSNQYNPHITRILFVLDGSGSMKEKWGNISKFESAKNLLFHIADSIEQINDKVEFAIRVFGHQSPKALHNCEDSKLEIPFGKKNAPKVKSLLDGIKPQGWTPIAYSLFQSANDFPNDPLSKNAIVLITDGLETCDGEPCAMSQLLEKKRVALKPFIIGLGIGKQGKINFECVGTYFDAANQQGFENAMNVVMSQALNNTSAQINLMDAYGQPNETDVEMTLYDFHSGEVRYNFVHALNDKGVSDTLFLDPTGRYNLTVHTIPSVSKTNLELVAGKHNIFAVDVPQGSLKLEVENTMGFSDVQCVVRKTGSNQILYVQDFNKTVKFLAGEYDLEILTMPRMEYKNISITQGKPYEIKIPKAGTLALSVSQSVIASIYTETDGVINRIFEMKDLNGKQNISLHPGIYQVVARGSKDRQSVLTQTQKMEIKSGQVTNIKF